MWTLLLIPLVLVMDFILGRGAPKAVLIGTALSATSVCFLFEKLANALPSGSPVLYVFAPLAYLLIPPHLLALNAFALWFGWKNWSRKERWVFAGLSLLPLLMARYM